MYYKSDNNKPSFYKKSQPRHARVALPSPAILREYDEVSEGAADRIIEMAEIEQNHRHEWEFESLQAYERSFRLGQKCGALVAIIVTLSAIYVGHFLKDHYLASVIAIGGFSSIIVSTIFASKNKRYENRIRRNASSSKTESPKPQE